MTEQAVNAKGQRICGAKARQSRSGLPVCQSVRLLSNGRCRMHGGTALKGPAHHSTDIHAPYSKYRAALGGQFRERFLNALADPDALSLRDDVALLTARIEEALSGTGAGDRLDAIQRAYAAFGEAAASGDAGRVRNAHAALGEAIAAAGGDVARFREVERLMKLKGRMATAEFKRQIAAATVIDAASAWALVSAILELVKTNVPDPVAKRTIAEGIARLTGRSTDPRAVG